MTVGGQGLPRLQELAYLETIAKATADRRTFEQIRLALVDQIWSVRQANPSDPPDPATYRAWRSDEKKYVSNVTDALKELMRLGFVENAVLPSSGRSAYAHKDATYQMTTVGREWVTELETDRRSAYDDLVPRLISTHPGLRCFLSTVGSIGDAGDTFVVPLLRWSALPQNQRTQQAYRSAIGAYVGDKLSSSGLGWRAEPTEISHSVNEYLERVLARSQARGKEPFLTVRAFTQTCEEALVRLAFGRAGCSIDYVSMEIARRWSRWLGLASFSYHVPDFNALRFWSTATIEIGDDGEMKVQRRAGSKWRDRALNALHGYCQQAQASGTTYVPVWEVRAAVCWELRIVDDEFDRAVTDMISGRRGGDLPWRLHLDQVSVGNTPSSASPFVLTTSTVGTRSFNVMTVVPKPIDR